MGGCKLSSVPLGCCNNASNAPGSIKTTTIDLSPTRPQKPVDNLKKKTKKKRANKDLTQSFDIDPVVNYRLSKNDPISSYFSVKPNESTDRQRSHDGYASHKVTLKNSKGYSPDVSVSHGYIPIKMIRLEKDSSIDRTRLSGG